MTRGARATDEIKRTGRAGVARLVLRLRGREYSPCRVLLPLYAPMALAHQALGQAAGRKWSPSWGLAGRASRSIWAC